MIYLTYAIFGLGSGGIIALIAAGLVVGYRGSGVVNFAQGGIAMYAAYLYYDLRVNGNYFQPIPGLGSGAQIGPSTGLGTAPSFVLALATAGVLGLLLHLIVLRPLRTAPQLAKVIATIGVLLTLQAAVTYRFGATAVAVPSMLPSGHLLAIGKSLLPNDRLSLCALSIVLALILWAFYSFTRFGLATRGAAENEKAAILLGYSPVFQAAVSWTLAGLLAGVAGILAAPITNLAPNTFSLLIIPGLAAALVGRFQSFGIATLTGILIGAAQSELTNLPTKFSWLPSTGLPDALPALIIIVVMFASGRAVPNRATVYLDRLPPVPEARRVVLPGLGLLIAGCIVLVLIPGGYRLASINTIIGAMGCLALVVLTGFVGQISLFQLVLSGIAAYMLGALANHFHFLFPFGLIVAALGAVVVGLVAALPALRVRGVNLAVITLALGWAVEQVFFNNTSYTGGYNGITLANPHLFGLNLGFTVGDNVARSAFAIFTLVVLVLLGAMVANLRRSDTGRRMLAVRANERAAAAMGISPGRTKMLAFAFSSFIAGIAGGVMAYQQVNIAPSAFDVFISMSVLAVAYIGGITTVTGAVIGGLLSAGGVIFYVLQTYVFTTSQNGTNVQTLIAGVGLVLTVIFNPNGLAIGIPASIKLPKRRVPAQPAPQTVGGTPVTGPSGGREASRREDPSIAAGERP